MLPSGESISYEAFKERPLSERIQEILTKRGIQAPPVELHVALIRHESLEDAASIDQDIRNADIFFPEAAGHTEKAEQTYRKSLNALFSLSFPVNPFDVQVIHSVRRSKARIGFVDIPRNHPLFRAHEEFFDSMDKEGPELLNDPNVSYEQALDFFRRNTMRAGKLMKQREEYMLARLPFAIADIITNTPELQSPEREKPIKVFMYLGASHVAVPSVLETPHGSVTDTTQTNMFYSSLDRARMKAANDYDLTVEDGSEVLMEQIFSVLAHSGVDLDNENLEACRKRYGLGAVVSILARVFKSEAEDVYVRFKKARAERNKSERRLFTDLLRSHAAQINSISEQYLK